MIKCCTNRRCFTVLYLQVRGCKMRTKPGFGLFSKPGHVFSVCRLLYVVFCFLVFGCQCRCNWLPRKAFIRMIYYVSSGMLNPTHLVTLHLLLHCHLLRGILPLVHLQHGTHFHSTRSVTTFSCFKCKLKTFLFCRGVRTCLAVVVRCFRFSCDISFIML